MAVSPHRVARPGSANMDSVPSFQDSVPPKGTPWQGLGQEAGLGTALQESRARGEEESLLPCQHIEADDAKGQCLRSPALSLARESPTIWCVNPRSSLPGSSKKPLSGGYQRPVPAPRGDQTRVLTGTKGPHTTRGPSFVPHTPTVPQHPQPQGAPGAGMQVAWLRSKEAGH